MRGRSWRFEDSARRAGNPPPIRVMLQLAKPAYCLRGTQGSNPCPSANLSMSLVEGDLRPPATRDAGRDWGRERQLMACGPLRFRRGDALWDWVLDHPHRRHACFFNGLTRFHPHCREPSAPPPSSLSRPMQFPFRGHLLRQVQLAPEVAGVRGRAHAGLHRSMNITRWPRGQW